MKKRSTKSHNFWENAIVEKIDGTCLGYFVHNEIRLFKNAPKILKFL